MTVWWTTQFWSLKSASMLFFKSLPTTQWGNPWILSKLLFKERTFLFNYNHPKLIIGGSSGKKSSRIKLTEISSCLTVMWPFCVRQGLEIIPQEASACQRCENWLQTWEAQPKYWCMLLFFFFKLKFYLSPCHVHPSQSSTAKFRIQLTETSNYFLPHWWAVLFRDMLLLLPGSISKICSYQPWPLHTWPGGQRRGLGEPLAVTLRCHLIGG